MVTFPKNINVFSAFKDRKIAQSLLSLSVGSISLCGSVIVFVHSDNLKKVKGILSFLVQCVYIYSNAKMPEPDMFEYLAYV